MIDERTRTEVQRLCTHVIARERHARTGRIGLSWRGTGIGTDALVLRLDGLQRVSDGRVQPITTLAAAAAFAGVRLDEPLSVGRDTPPLGVPDEPLAVDPGALAELLAFYERMWSLLAEVADGAERTLWPEHFDVAFVWRETANVGASPGDGFSAAPYVYVGPWAAERPGPPSLWNAPFGAVIDPSRPDGEIVEFIRLRLAALQP